MFNWMTMLLNIVGKNQSFLTIFNKRRKNRGMLWGSLISLGLGAATYGLRRYQQRTKTRLFQNFMEKTNSGMMNAQNPNIAGLTEFANELFPTKNPHEKI